jgi:hypothetical protein
MTPRHWKAERHAGEPIACDLCGGLIRQGDTRESRTPWQADYEPGGLLDGQGERAGLILLHTYCASTERARHAS